MSLQQILLGGSPSGYLIDKSLRFRASASANLSRTNTSIGNRQIFTFSFWVKRGALGTTNYLYNAGSSSSDRGEILFNSSNQLNIGCSNGSFYLDVLSAMVFRDPSAWYHIVLAFDTTQATNTNRVKLYVNGVQQTLSGTWVAQNQNTNGFFDNVAQYIGRTVSGGSGDYYAAEFYGVNGQALTPASFGETNALTGVWQPKAYTGTYGTNGFYLDFEDTSSVAALGTDKSGNGNTWTVNNISLTAGVTYDSMTDVPTLTSDTAANYAVLNPVSKTSTVTLSNGNLTFTGSNAAAGTIFAPSGKFYVEANFVGVIGTTGVGFGFVSGNKTLPLAAGYPGAIADLWYVYNGGGATATFNSETTATNTTSGAIPVSGNTLQLCIDVDAGKAWYGQNNTWYNSSGGTTGDPATGANPTFTISSPSTRGGFALFLYTFASGATFQANFGQRPFAYTPPTGFVALNTFNLPTATILKGNTVMDATLYTGNGGTLAVTNAAGFKPDLVWVKSRSTTGGNYAFDSVRGAGYRLSPDGTDAETYNNNSLTSFNSDGFSLGNIGGAINGSGTTFVGWQWQAGQGTTSSNTNGTITSTVSVNATAGFSVVTYTGTGSGSITVGHGLGVAPAMIIIKNRQAAVNWLVYHRSMGNTTGMQLNLTTAATGSDAGYWNLTSPTSTVFTSGTYGNQAQNFVAYCWAEIDGFSRFGSYVGNSNADGPFIYCGFRPKFVLFKGSSFANNWYIIDSSTNTINVAGAGLIPNASTAETATSTTENAVDFLSNGFKLRNNAASVAFNNSSGQTFIYAAFAENPFKNSLAR